MSVWKSVTAGLCVLVLTSCAVGPDYKAPDLDLPESYRTAFKPDESLEAPWWTGFEDEILNDLVDRALANNLDIGVAVLRVAEARADVRSQWSDLFPTIDGAASGTLQDNTATGTRTTGDAGAVMSFTADIFGAQRRRLEQARAAAEAAGFSLEDARRLTVASVVDRYVNLRRTEVRLDLLETSLDLQRQTLDIVRQRLSAGLASDLDVQRATADLARTRAQRGTLAAAKRQSENALAVLLGEAPRDGLIASPDEPTVPKLVAGPPVSVPATLLRQRPDVLAAEQDLVAATAAVGVEVSDLYPALRLPGQVTANFEDGGGSTVTSALTAALDIPLFDLGRRRAEVRAARQRMEAARLTYKQTVLISVNEVEEALAAIEGLAERRDELLKAIEASELAYSQLNALYKEGLASFIDILDAQRTLIDSREAYVEAEADLSDRIIDLYSALGAPVPAM